MSSTLSPTLFYDLTSPKQGVTRREYPATDLIYKLLHHTGADVSSFRRNCQVSYRLVEYARDLYDEINSRIEKAELSGSWEQYDEYHRAIDPLEEALLSIMEVTAVEREEYLINGAPLELAEKPVEEWIKQSISNWQDDTKKIRESFKQLRTQEELKGLITSPDDEIEIESAKAHDDRTLLQNLLRSIGDNEAKVEKVKPQNSETIKKVKSGLQSALDYLKGGPKKQLGEELGVLAIKSAMIMYGVTELMKREDIKQYPELFDRLYGTKIWKAADALATKIHDNLKDNEAAPNLAGLDQFYDELEAALTGEVAVLMPDDYLKLFPLVGKIGRAYHAQSLFLASLCHKLATQYKENKFYDAHGALEKALAKTIEAFTAAGGLNSEPITNGTNYTTNGANGIAAAATGEYNGSCEQLYNECISAISSCYTEMKLDEGPDLQGKLEEARGKDQARLQSYQTRITNAIHAPKLVDLTLKVYQNDSNDSTFNEIHAKVLSTARLSYIKWLTIKELEDVKIVRFENPIDNQPMHLDADIQPLVNENQCTLHLIVRKESEANGTQ